MNLFDSHAHYNDEKFDQDRKEIIRETLENNVSNFIVSGYNIESSKKAIRIAKEYKEAYAIVGISPNDLEDIQAKEDIEKNIRKLKDIVGVAPLGDPIDVEARRTVPNTTKQNRSNWRNWTRLLLE